MTDKKCADVLQRSLEWLGTRGTSIKHEELSEDCIWGGHRVGRPPGGPLPIGRGRRGNNLQTLNRAQIAGLGGKGRGERERHENRKIKCNLHKKG